MDSKYVCQPKVCDHNDKIRIVDNGPVAYVECANCGTRLFWVSAHQIVKSYKQIEEY